MVQIKAAGINNTDINTRIAWYSKNNNDSKDASWSGERVLIEPSLQKSKVTILILN